MGHKVKRKAYKMIFADGSPLDGATILMGTLSIGELVEFGVSATKAKSIADAADSGAVGPEFVEAINDLTKTIGTKLISWDLEEEDGTPIPANVQGVSTLEIPWIMALIGAWTNVLVNVDPSLGKESASGVTSLEASIPMETLSESQAS